MRRLLGAVFVLSYLSACQSPRVLTPLKNEVDTAANAAVNVEATATPSDAVLDDILLAGDESFSSDTLVEEPRIQITAEYVDIRTFVAGLLVDSVYSVVIHPDVSGEITMNVKDVTLPEVMRLLSRMYNYDVQLEGKVYQILPPGLKTEIIAIDYLMMKRNGTSSVNVNAGGVSQNANNNNNSSSGGGSNNNSNFSNNSNSGNNNSQGGFGGGQGAGTFVQTENETNFWYGLHHSLATILGMQASAGGGSGESPNSQNSGSSALHELGTTDESGRVVAVNPVTGLVTIRAFPQEINSIKEFLSRSQQILERQVIIEAKIVEVTLNDDYQQGINWTQALAHAGDTDFIFSNTGGSTVNSTASSLGGVTNIRFQNKDFTGVVNLLDTQGNVQVLSSPRITALNNQKAVIKVGVDEYFVTDVSNTTVTGNATTTAPEIDLTPFFSGIALDVTPQINDEGYVILHIHPSVIETAEQEKIVTLNEQQFVLPLARSNIRESDTIIKARSNEIVVIGGLMQTSISDTYSQTPVVGDIPVVGNLFRSKRETEVKKELVILLKASIVGAGTWQQQLKRSSELLDDWYQE